MKRGSFNPRIAPDGLRRLAVGPQERAPHPLAVGEAGLPGDRLDGMTGLLHQQARGLDPQVLHRLGGRLAAAYADRLAKRGHDLILVARSVDRLQTLADRIAGETGRKVEVIAADLGKRKDLAMVEAVLRTDDPAQPVCDAPWRENAG